MTGLTSWLQIVSLCCLFIFNFKAFSLNVPNCGKSPFRDLSKLVQKISLIGQEDRELYSEYAQRKGISLEMVEKQFGATGIITCGGDGGTAQLTGNALVLTTAAHVFYDQNCNLHPGEKCIFAIRKPGSTSEFDRYEVDKSTLKVGDKCQRDVDRAEDWAVVELKSPVPLPKGVKPYRLASSDLSGNPGQLVTQVSGFSKNFHPELNMPKYIVECQLKDAGLDPKFPLQSDCDSGGGASGSAQLIRAPDGSFELASIHVAHGPSTIDGADYTSNRDFNISIPARGNFRAAIENSIQTTNARLGIDHKKVKSASAK